MDVADIAVFLFFNAPCPSLEESTLPSERLLQPENEIGYVMYAGYARMVIWLVKKWLYPKFVKNFNILFQKSFKFPFTSFKANLCRGATEWPDVRMHKFKQLSKFTNIGHL